MFKVLQPATFARLDLRNRFIRSATWDSRPDADGRVNDLSMELHEGIAAGGVGLIVVANATISEYSHKVFARYGIYSDEMIPGLKRITQVAHKHGAKVAIQLCYSGAAFSHFGHGHGDYSGPEILGPSQIEHKIPHRAMTEDEIEGVIDDFAAAAVRAREAGFDAVQLHGGHGFIMTQFFSPITNRRQDRWGGNSENRRRLHVETVRRVRAAVGPDFPILIKFGIQDDAEGGATLDEGIAALKAMSEAGLDGVEISVGLGSPGSIAVVDGAVNEVTALRERAAKAKRAVNIPLAVVSGIRSLETAEDIVNSGDADFISMSRPFIREPGLINRWLSGDYARAKCISCAKCMAIIRRHEPLECGEEKKIREEQGRK